MDLSIIWVKMASNCLATTGNADFSSAFALARNAPNPDRSVQVPTLFAVTLPAAMALDHPQFGMQGNGLLERLQDGDQVAGTGPHLVHRAHDLVQAHARAELEHVRAVFGNAHRR